VKQSGDSAVNLVKGREDSAIRKGGVGRWGRTDFISLHSKVDTEADGAMGVYHCNVGLCGGNVVNNRKRRVIKALVYCTLAAVARS